MVGRVRKRALEALALAVCASVGVGAGGCSFVMVDAPPARHETLPYFDCTTSRLAPAVDGVLSLVAMSVTISAASDDSEGSQGMAVAAATLAGAALASAAHGMVRTEHCIDAKKALQARALRLPPPPVPMPTGAPAPDPWLASGPPPFPAFAPGARP